MKNTRMYSYKNHFLAIPHKNSSKDKHLRNILKTIRLSWNLIHHQDSSPLKVEGQKTKPKG